ncbi:hypothetical protein HRbin23_01652 [bacterium HR23]|nr:hypothetical protein HRbin23_01652 [bacterium HR23]
MRTTKAWRGQKVLLREKLLSDAPDDYRWRSDEELARLDAAPPLRMPFQEYLRFYQDELRYPYPWSRRFAIDTLDGKHIGNCMYYDIDYTTGEAELGIMIGEKDYWNQGYGTDAVKTLLHHIFTETPLKRIYLHTLEWNTRAQRSFAKAGFVPVRTVRRNGQTFVRMEITRERWLTLQQERGRDSPPETLSPP